VFGRLIGGAIGALVTFVLLWLYHADATEWAIAAIVGALVAFLWPSVIGWYLARRSQRHREDEIELEVQRRVARQQDEIPPR
jgi:multisubunit Na+/H+ antiporter MnhG subunit